MSKNKPESKSIRLESAKLTKKQLQTPSYMSNGMGVRLTIGELSLDQLRVELYQAKKEAEMVDKCLEKAHKWLENAMP